MANENIKKRNTKYDIFQSTYLKRPNYNAPLRHRRMYVNQMFFVDNQFQQSSLKGGTQLLQSHFGSIKMRTYANRRKGVTLQRRLAYNFFN